MGYRVRLLTNVQDNDCEAAVSNASAEEGQVSEVQRFREAASASTPPFSATVCTGRCQGRSDCVAVDVYPLRRAALEG
jgi:hypothetical protein